MSSARSSLWCAGCAIAMTLAATPFDRPAAAETWDLANQYNATSLHAEGDVLFAPPPR